MSSWLRERSPRRAQRGWVGIVVLILALLIVAMLSRSALDQYLGGSITRGGAAAGASAGSSGPPDPNAASTPMPSRKPMEQARAVNELVQQQSAEMKKRVDEAEK